MLHLRAGYYFVPADPRSPATTTPTHLAGWARAHLLPVLDAADGADG